MPGNSVIWLICIVIAVLICVLWVLICYIGFCKLRLQRRSDEESLLGAGLFLHDPSLPSTPPSQRELWMRSNGLNGGPHRPEEKRSTISRYSDWLIADSSTPSPTLCRISCVLNSTE
ncbi:uncharacterized protein LOC119104343 [Pollicipes pollicipes]|uniref:uncharacterized protein LOC119104343 n=1 Tax=Pollicipes pollicipes TaxID=41117 RepID=UPI001884D630|nr:uncharacterized protein LOC119104343 [Pollicipes pollicipes]